MESIRKAVRQSAELCRLVQENYLAANTKTSGGHAEPVTIADYGSQAIICRALQREFPDDAVVAEESGAQFMQLVAADERSQVRELLAQVLAQPISETELVSWLDFGAGRAARRTWVIDPIDGTKGFIARRHYAIACGWLIDGQVAGGIIAAPGYAAGKGALFYTDGGVAWREALAGGQREEISVSQRSHPAEFVAAQSYARAHASKTRMGRARELAGLGGARIIEMDSMEKYALVACGDADLYLRLPRAGSEYAHKIWDHAAGVALARAAGGLATGLDGEALDFSLGEALPNAGMVVSNGQLHERVVAAVGRVMRE